MVTHRIRPIYLITAFIAVLLLAVFRAPYFGAFSELSGNRNTHIRIALDPDAYLGLEYDEVYAISGPEGEIHTLKAVKVVNQANEYLTMSVEVSLDASGVVLGVTSPTILSPGEQGFIEVELILVNGLHRADLDVKAEGEHIFVEKRNLTLYFDIEVIE